MADSVDLDREITEVQKGKQLAESILGFCQASTNHEFSIENPVTRHQDHVNHIL